MSVMVGASRYMNELVCEVPISARPVVVSSTCMLVKSLLPFMEDQLEVEQALGVQGVVVADVSREVAGGVGAGSRGDLRPESAKGIVDGLVRRRVIVPAAYSVNEMIRGRVVSAVKLVAWARARCAARRRRCQRHP